MANRTGKLKQLLTAVVVVSVGLVVWIFFQFRQQQSSLTLPVPENATQAIMALSRVHHTATKDGAVQWKLEANSAELESDSGKMILNNPLIDFFLEDGGRVNLRALKGILNTRNNDIKVEGHVIVVNGRYTLKTDTLAYQHQQRLMQADTPVQIIGQTFNLKAATMIYDLDANQVTFNGDVKGTIHEKPST
jgi:LPS export ABC transporter protein LptC